MNFYELDQPLDLRLKAFNLMPIQNNSTTTTTTTTSSVTTTNTSNTTITTSSNSSISSPIIRQNSLVSRYNCKPCGIVFSQPETLRAHQEGYCTKRDRSQSTQLRSQSAVSQSAVSPSAIQHSTTNPVM